MTQRNEILDAMRCGLGGCSNLRDYELLQHQKRKQAEADAWAKEQDRRIKEASCTSKC
jgi:hypothetical protein